MKKILLSFSFLILMNTLFAQWATSGADIYNSNTGNVGIGGLPIRRLTVVAGAAGDGIWIGGTGTTNVALLNNVGAGSWNSLTQTGDNLILWKGSAPDNANAGGLVLAPWSVASGVIPGIRISASGSVGIGTANTYTYMLAVNGSAIFTQAVVKLNGNWPDYVFKKEYKLPSLDELETYIRNNSHLPGLPSAENVQKDGLDLGSTEAKLLEKIEELTLYSIELEKKVEKLETANKEREASNKKMEGLQQQIDELKALLKK